MRKFGFGMAVFALVAGVAYLSTLGCCQLMSRAKKPISLTNGLQLAPLERQKVAGLEQDFMRVKQEMCGRLCAKRAQLIQLLRSKEADAASLNTLAQEIGEEQIALEKATLSHMMALRNVLSPSQADRLTARMTEELRMACEKTACGMTAGCEVTGKK